MSFGVCFTMDTRQAKWGYSGHVIFGMYQFSLRLGWIKLLVNFGTVSKAEMKRQFDAAFEVVK